MKTNLIRKFKWYIVGFIIVVIMLSVGLSFCTWDNLSIKALNAKVNTGGYYDTHALNDYVTLVVDNNGNKLADVGDIVQYGRYWQRTDASGEEMLDPLRWIVVNIDETKSATLLAEKVVAYGHVWGLNSDYYYQNYYQSTLRSWLNSGRESVTKNGAGWTLGNVAKNVGDENWRDDGIGSPFNGDITNEFQANRGFLDVAFNIAEQSIILPKEISGIIGQDKTSINGEAKEYATRNGKSSINDLIWIPSYKEVYGNIQYGNTDVLDGTPNKQFQYFNSAQVTEGVHYNTIAAAMVSATDYAWNNYDSTASYYNNGKGSRSESQAKAWWWLRSPHPELGVSVLAVSAFGSGGSAGDSDPRGGVRPAVCIQL